MYFGVHFIILKSEKGKEAKSVLPYADAGEEPNDFSMLVVGLLCFEFRLSICR